MSEQTETTPKQNIFKRLKPAGWLALGVLAVLVVGLLGNGYRAVFGVNRLHPLETPRPAAPDPTAADAAPTTTPAATPTALPTPDPDEAWETFMEAIYKCDALPDKGDDLAAYPETLEELTEGIEDLTTDEVWIDWCDSALRRLAKFGPQNMECENNICHTAVSVKNTGGITFFEKWCAENPEQCAEFKAEEPELYAQRKGEQIIISRPPLFEDHHPFRLIEGKVMLEEDTWIVTQIKIKDLPPEPEGSLQSP